MNTKKMSLMNRIDEIRANSVTDEEFKALWGKSIDEHVDELMKWAEQWDVQQEKNCSARI